VVAVAVAVSGTDDRDAPRSDETGAAASFIVVFFVVGCSPGTAAVEIGSMLAPPAPRPVREPVVAVVAMVGSAATAADGCCAAVTVAAVAGALTPPPTLPPPPPVKTANNTTIKLTTLYERATSWSVRGSSPGL